MNDPTPSKLPASETSPGLDDTSEAQTSASADEADSQQEDAPSAATSVFQRILKHRDRYLAEWSIAAVLLLFLVVLIVYVFSWEDDKQDKAMKTVVPDKSAQSAQPPEDPATYDKSVCTDTYCPANNDSDVWFYPAANSVCSSLPDFQDLRLPNSFTRQTCFQAHGLRRFANSLQATESSGVVPLVSSAGMHRLADEMCETLAHTVTDKEALSQIVFVVECDIDLDAVPDVASENESSSASQSDNLSSPTVPAFEYFGVDHLHETSSVTIAGPILPLHDYQSAEDVAVGQPAPAFQAFSFDETLTNVNPGDGKGKVLSFYAHWCPYCQEEVPRVVSWLNNSQPPDNVDFVAINTEIYPEEPNYPPSEWFAREQWPLSYPLLLDSAANEIAEAYGLSAFPYTVVIDSEGFVVERVSGAVNENEWERLVGLAQN